MDTVGQVPEDSQTNSNSVDCMRYVKDIDFANPYRYVERISEIRGLISGKYEGGASAFEPCHDQKV